MVMPPTTVSSAPVKEEDWAPTLSAVGSVSAVEGAIVSTELGGVVSEVEFQNGGVAKKGDVLLKLDSSAEEGQLHTAEADLEFARANLAAHQRSRRAQSRLEAGTGRRPISLRTKTGRSRQYAIDDREEAGACAV